MPNLRTFVLTLMMALSAISGIARAMPMPTAPPPCHDAPNHNGKSTPAPAMMNCCVGCLPAPAEGGPALQALPLKRPDYLTLAQAVEGRLTTPEPEPPRRSA